MSASQNTSRLTELAALLVTIFGTGMVYLDQSAINVALPHIQIALNADVGGLQWLIDIYILVLAVLLLIGGALGDRYGRVRVFRLGLIIFAVSSIVCGLANSLGVLIAARAVQGLGGALLVPGGLAIINTTTAPERRGQMLGWWGTFTPLVVLSGPLVGGWLVDNISWRAIFYLNIPLGIVALVAAHFVPESRNEEAAARLDWPGVISLMIGLSGLLFGFIEGPEAGWSPAIVAALSGGVIGLLAFLWIEWRSPAPLLPLGLFRNRAFTGINLMSLVHYFALSGIFFFLTLNLQQAQGYTAFQSGLAYMPINIALITLGRPVGRLTDRLGAVPLMAAGVAASGLGFLLFALPGLSDNYWTSFFPALVVYGLGLGLTIVPLTAMAMGSLPENLSGIASGFNNAISRISQMLAVAVLGAVLASSFRASLIQRTAAIPLTDSTRTELLASARDLGATRPPTGLADSASAATKLAVRLSFVDAFRQMMFICAGLTVLTLLITLSLPRTRRVEQTAPVEAA